MTPTGSWVSSMDTSCSANSAPYTQLLHLFGHPEPLGGVWTAEGFLGCTEICFMEGREGHLPPRLTDWELGVMDSRMHVWGRVPSSCGVLGFVVPT